MAGAIASGDDEDMVSDINIVPLVDVILVLLIVFMITMPTIVGSAPIKVDLPETAAAAAISGESLPLKFTLRRETGGQLTLLLQEQPTTRDKLEETLKQIGITEETSAFLSSDRSIPYGEVIKIMDMLGSLGLKKISLDTKHLGP